MAKSVQKMEGFCSGVSYPRSHRTGKVWRNQNQ